MTIQISRHTIIGAPSMKITRPKSAAAFSPLDLSPVLWLDFSDASTLFQDSAGNTPVVSDGDVIGRVEDKSGNCITSDTCGFFGTGYQRVSEVMESDSIYQLGGKLGQIRKAWSRPHNGTVIRIKARGMRAGLTPEHRVLRVPRATIDRMRQDKRAGGEIDPGAFETEWVPAEQIESGDLLIVPRPSMPSEPVFLEFQPGEVAYQKQEVMARFGGDETPSDIDPDEYGLQADTIQRYWNIYRSGEYNPTNRNIANRVDRFDEGWAEIFGWWVAEGVVSRRKGVPSRALFSLGPTEMEQANRLVRLLDEKGVTARVTERDTTLVVVASSVPLSKFLVESFGSGARNKVIPEWLLEAEDDLIKTFLLAYIGGDGHVSEQANNPLVEIATSSRGLVLGVSLLLMKIGYLPAIYPGPNGRGRVSEINGRKINSGRSWHIKIAGADAAKLLGVKPSRRSREIYLSDDNNFYVRVFSAEREQYSGDVYDFTSDTHSLGLPFIVHNSNHATQATTANKPLYKTGIQNGLSVGRWDGSDDGLRANSVASNFSGTDRAASFVFVVIPEGSGTFRAMTTIYDPVSSAFIGFLLSSGNKLRFQQKDSGAGNKPVDSAASVPPSSAALLEAISDGDAVDGYKDGSQIIAGGDVDVGSVPATEATIGVDGRAFLNSFSGDIGEVFLFSSALSTADRQSLETYLNDKWSIY